MKKLLFAASLLIAAIAAHAGLISLGGNGRTAASTSSSSSPLITGLMLDDYSHGFRSDGTANGHSKTIFNYTDVGDTSIVTDTSAAFLTRGNTHSLRTSGVYMDPTYGPRLQMYVPNTAMEGVTCWSNTRYWVRRFVENPPGTSSSPGGGCAASGGAVGLTWATQTYQFMRFWVKAPAGYTSNGDDGQNNVEWGTFLKSTEGDYTSDTDNNHYYHEFLLKSCSGCWQLVILDPHPQHQRGNSGHDETGYVSTPYSAKNYWDVNAGMYFDVYPAVTGNYDFKAFEFYADAAEVTAAAHIATLTGWFKGTELFVAWNKDTTDNTGTHDVRYAFSDIHTLGWANATNAPGTYQIDATVNGDYTQMGYDGSGINATGHSWIYVAIKRSGDSTSTFRQIVLPVQS